MPTNGIAKERSLTLTSWNLIKEEYAAGDMSYRALAKKHGVSLKVLSKTAHAEGWPALRKQRKEDGTEPLNSCATSEESSSEKKTENIHSEQSFDFEETENERSEANGDGDGIFSPAPEQKEPPDILTVADQLLARVSEMVRGANAQALKSLSGTLKDLKEITGFKTEDERLEQDARLRKLRRESMRDEDLLSEIEVVLRAGPEAWNE